MRVLITGMSGAGKSSVIRRLDELGHTAVDLDSPRWSLWIDAPDDPTGASPGRDWVWREAEVQELLSRAGADPLFVSGCAANMGQFLPHFDHVVLLSAPVDVLLERVRTRTGNSYGRRPSEVAAVRRNAAEIEPRLRRVAGHEIDVRNPLPEVVEMILRLAHRPPSHRERARA